MDPHQGSGRADIAHDEGDSTLQTGNSVVCELPLKSVDLKFAPPGREVGSRHFPNTGTHKTIITAKENTACSHTRLSTSGCSGSVKIQMVSELTKRFLCLRHRKSVES